MAFNTASQKRTAAKSAQASEIVTNAIITYVSGGTGGGGGVPTVSLPAVSNVVT